MARSSAIGVFFLLVVVIAYAPTLWTPYFFYDDYVQLTWRDPNIRELFNFYLTQYRPGFGVWLYLINSGKATIPDSTCQRFVGVFGLALLALLLRWWMRVNGHGKCISILLPLFVVLLTAYQSVIGYVSSGVSVYCCLLAGLAIPVLFHGCGRAAAIRARSFGCALLWGGGGGLLCALLTFVPMWTYQPPAMFGSVMLAIVFFSPRLENWARVRNWTLLYFACLGLAIGATVACSRLLLLWIGMPALGRTAIISPEQVPAKLEWFTLTVIPTTISRLLAGYSTAWALKPVVCSTIVSILVMSMLVFPFYRMGRRRLVDACELLVLVAILFPVAYLPLLSVQENAFLSVYLTSLAPLIVISLVLMSAHLGLRLGGDSFLPTRVRAQLGSLLMGVLLGGSVLCCNRNMMEVYAIPNNIEYRFVRAKLQEADLAGLRRVHIVGHLNFSGVLTYSQMLVQAVLNELAVDHAVEVSVSSKTPPVAIHQEVLDGNPGLLGRMYVMTPHGYYLRKPGLSGRQYAALERYFGSLREKYAKKGALVIDISGLEKVTGSWSGLF